MGIDQNIPKMKCSNLHRTNVVSNESFRAFRNIEKVSKPIYNKYCINKRNTIRSHRAQYQNSKNSPKDQIPRISTFKTKKASVELPKRIQLKEFGSILKTRRKTNENIYQDDPNSISFRKLKISTRFSNIPKLKNDEVSNSLMQNFNSLNIVMLIRFILSNHLKHLIFYLTFYLNTKRARF